MEDIYEKRVVKCASCGKEMHIVIHKKIKTNGLLCQRCGQGAEKIEED